MPSAISAAASAWSGRGSGAPATAMYASPTVLIFSMPNRSANPSNRVNTSSSTTTSSRGSMRAACSVNRTRSAKSTVTGSSPSAIWTSSGSESLACSRSTIEPGSVLRSRSSARRRAPFQLPLAQEHQARVPLQPVCRRHADDARSISRKESANHCSLTVSFTIQKLTTL